MQPALLRHTQLGETWHQFMQVTLWYSQRITRTHSFIRWPLVATFIAKIHEIAHAFESLVCSDMSVYHVIFSIMNNATLEAALWQLNQFNHNISDIKSETCFLIRIFISTMWQQANAIAYFIPKHNQDQDTSVCLYHLPVETRNTRLYIYIDYIYICIYCILYTYIYIYMHIPIYANTAWLILILTPRALHIASVWLVPPEHLAKTETKTIVNLVDGVYNCIWYI